jgi:8-oxo-dGTP diphosphatase
MTESTSLIALGTVWAGSPSGWRVLVAQRRPDALVLPGYWEIPGGKVEVGEDPLEAARRELWEETGIAPPPAALWVDCGTHVGTSKGSSALAFRVFLAPAPPRCNPQPRSSAQVRWVGPQEYAQLLWPESNGPISALLMRALECAHPDHELGCQPPDGAT